MPAKRNLLAVILGGGAGTRLFPLTQQRSKPAVPVGGKYRLVDIPISNCINSDVLKQWQAIARDTAWKDYGEKSETCAALLKAAQKLA